MVLSKSGCRRPISIETLLRFYGDSDCKNGEFIRPAESIGSEDLAIFKNVQKAANLGYCTKGTKTHDSLEVMGSIALQEQPHLGFVRLPTHLSSSPGSIHQSDVLEATLVADVFSCEHKAEA
ncbi:hypothetical protein RRG08_041763 [Elysia crispata]|uniref:Uncharacterized protein n=1 Tax=Elysia crispata TaxID=231223 RepID=A0AAE1D7Q1_9GAST|nr:hypothetical protein RRG08_041763 [Elysia crispata]